MNAPAPSAFPRVRDVRNHAAFVLNLSRTGGDVVPFGKNGTTAYLVNCPAYARHVLAVNERNYANPYHPYAELAPHYRPGGLFLLGLGNVRKDRAVAAEVARGIVAAARKAALQVSGDGRRVIGVEATMRALTFEVVVRHLFGVEAAAWAPRFVEASSFLEECWANGPRTAPAPVAEHASETAAHEVQHRAARSIARAAAIVPEGASVPDEMVVAIVRTLLNSYNASAIGLTWALYEIARRPDVQARAQREIATTVGDRAAEAADLRALPYLRHVVLETLRLYPPAWNIGRTAIGPDRLGDTGVLPGSAVLVPPYTLHRLSRIWPNANEFVPERHRERRRPPYAYLPFGGGRRRCPAAAVAVGHLQLMLATWLHLCEVEPVDPEPVRRRGLVALRPDPPLRLRFTPRN